MISEKLAGFYTKLEDKYFDLLDSLDKKGLPVYTYSDFFEDKGIPSFIITITILLLLILGIGFFATTPLTGSGEMIISLKDITTNQPLQNVSLKIYNEQNELIYSQVVSNGNKINIPPQKQGTILKLIAEKQGYENGMANQMIGLESTSTSISLSKQFVGIRAKLRLTDSLTTTKITSAIVTARYGEQIFNLTIDGNGIYTQSNVPQGETLILSITADGYNPLTQEITFFAESTKDLTLEPSNNGFVGMASLIITVSDFDGKSIDDAEVTIYNKTNQAVLLKKFSQQGAVSDQIQTGIPLKITIKKEGYLNYDSDNDGGITLREQEKKIDVLMAKGGEKLLINSVNSLGLNLSGTLIQLFDMYGEVIDEGITTSSGIEFIGLNPDSQIFITAYKEGFLPERTKIIVSNSEIVTLVLKETNQTNSFRLDFFTLDSFGNTVTNARITLIEIIDGNREPVGYEEIITSLAGYASAVIKSGGVYEIQAETFVLEGYKTIEVNETTVDNKVYLNMTKKANVIELKLIDLLGESIRGNAIISTLDGTTIYDGNIQNGKIFFNRLDYKMVELKIELDDGNIFLENVYVYGKDFIEIIVYNKDSDELAPIIEFVGLENENGEIVKGITPGAFYWAKFSVKWPIATEQGGVHFRTGQNNIEFVESENIAIFDLSLQNASKIFSYTYSPTPLPGNESLDRTNQGFENEANKWVEGIVNNPKGTYVAKVKIRASDFTAGKIPINYRAWSQLQNQTYRTPTDPELENNNFSQEKSGLYAKTLIKELTLFESLPECTDDLCVAFNFVDNKENYFDLTKFEALEHEIYALEVEFTATNADYLQINLTTDSNLTFLGVQNNNFNFMTETGYTSKEASSVVSLTANSKQKIRIYFIAQDTGTNIINFSASGKEDIIKTISFESVIEKELIVELSEKKIKLGRNFTIKVLEQNLRGIDNALIKIINKQGEVVKSIVGNGTDGIGKDGLYRIQNDLEQGIYTASVTAQKYKEKTEAFIITNQDILTINDEFNAKLMFEEKTRMIDAKLTNNSDFLINDISFQSDNSENFKIDIITPHSIAKQQSQNIQINITYIGKEESADETIELQIKGLVENTFLTSTSTIINATYNRTLNSNCLVLTPSSLKLAILGSQGAQGNSVIEATNNCEMPISLKNRVSEKTKRSYIAVTSEDIILQPGQTSNLTISANNLLDRVFNRNETYNFEIIFDSNYLKKVLPITIELINPRIALSYPGQITLFLAQNNAKEKAIAIQPVFVTNVSQFSVEGIGFSVNTEYATQSNVKLTIEPPAQVSLESGQSINPTKMIVAEASTKFSEPVKSQILISGRMGNLDSRVGSKDNYDYQALLSGQMNLSNYNNNSKGYSTGTDNLGIIEVMTYYSGYDCLKISGVDNSTFNLTQDGLGRNSKITIQNDCAEPVRLLDIKANYPNLLFSIPNLIISPGQMIETQMGIMSMGGNVNLRSYPLTLRGLTEISQTPIEAKPFNVNIFSGVNFNEEYSKSETGIKAMVCGEGETRIDIPRSATGIDCANGYCDAQQAAEYIAKKLDQAIKKAESQAYSAQKTNEKMACFRKGYCTFSDIGTQTTNFDLYLKNDVISVQTIKNSFEEISKGTQGFTGLGGNYRYETMIVDEQTMGQIAQSGYGRQILIDSQLKGCGYYNIEINGVFPVSAEGVDFTMPIVVIKAASLIGDGKIQTKECVESIENLINFTPIDEKYSLKDTGGTWLTSIEAEAPLTDLAETLSKKLFKNDNRIGFGNGNKIILKEGALTSSLAELCLIGGETKIIEVRVNPTTKGMNEQTKKAFEQELSKLITNSLSGNFGNNCLVKAENKYTCVRLEDASGFKDGLNLELDTTTLNMGKDGGCISGEISSNIPEEIVFNINPYEINKAFTNVTRITISEEDNKDNKYYEIEYAVGKNYKEVIIEPVKLEVLAQRVEKNYSRRIEICAYSTPDILQGADGAYLHSNGVEFIVKAINKSAGNSRGTADVDGKVTIVTDSLHPDDLIKILTNKAFLGNKRGEENPYYFTAMWKGDPQIIPNLKNYSDDLVEKGLLDDTLIAKADGTTQPTKKALDIEAEDRKKAINSYLIACTSATTVCNLGTGGINVAFSVVADCFVPAATLFKKDLASNYNWFKSLYSTLTKIPLIGPAFEIPDKFVEVKEFDAFAINMGGTGLATGAAERLAVNTVRYGALGQIGALNPNIANWSADLLKTEWEKQTTEVIKNTFNTIPSNATEFTKNYSANLAEEFKKQYMELHNTAIKRKIPVIGRSVDLTPKEANEVISKAIDNSFGKVNKDMVKQMESLVGASGTPNLTPQVLATKLKPGSQMGQLINNLDISRITPEIISGKIDLIDNSIVAQIQNAPDASRLLKGQIELSVDQIAREIGMKQNLNTTQILDLKTKILNNIPANSYDDMVQTITTPMVTGGRVSTIKQIKSHIVVKGKINAVINDATNTAIRNSDDMFKLAGDNFTQLQEAMKADIRSKMKAIDITKDRSFGKKLGNFFSLKMIGSIARSAGCGAFANLAGAYFYKEQLGETANALNKSLTIIPEQELEKGITYKIIIENKISGETEEDSGLKAHLERVDTPELKREMGIALGEEKNKELNGTPLKWFKELNEKRPEERMLNIYGLKMSSKELIEKLSDAGFTKVQIDNVKKYFNNTEFALLVKKYSEDTTMKTFDNELLNEQIITGIIIVQKPSDGDLTRELEGKTSEIKEKLKQILKIFEENKSINVDMQVAQKMYSDETKQKEFFTIVNGVQPRTIDVRQNK